MQKHQVMGIDSQGFHNMTYYEWGDSNNPKVLLCVHGLFRNGRDFDDLAQVLSSHYRVICPDMVGRGLSDKVGSPKDYSTLTYLSDITILLAQLAVTKIDYLGTSMGGIIGIVMAAMKKSPIKKLVLNDIGPFVDTKALQRIIAYGKEGSERSFETLGEVEAYLKKIYSSFAQLSPEQWQHLAMCGVWQNPMKQYQLAYDPQIIENVILATQNNIPQWALWSRIQCPILLLHASLSDVLSNDTVAKMQQLQTTLKTISIPDIDHPVSLMKKNEIELVKQWLIGS
ncbi:alpha/beta fold hydrolase [Legionella cincinnatiensis]|uniref:Alpha/beta hydrolase n=1 Tax=Legionella cincinnatiensis TaxID=28085 RepID=A0A378IK72_9GAMM|nr:alpha/beta hydrolase [Legionella cincinnatiensis]KTC83480.1 alpha/beta hydrolase [Legionella cincinnatiensis]STX35569.1 alpha/beta hydrolase [Legionella cincinnatiensis]